MKTDALRAQDKKCPKIWTIVQDSKIPERGSRIHPRSMLKSNYY